jgi:5-methylcytosine-specific restriction endonuclease McrA
MRRDGGLCWCGEIATVIHHVQPVSAGGTDELSNLVALCDRHHRVAHRQGA